MPESNTGRDIPVVTIGDGPTAVTCIAQQHGNEYVASEGMVELVRDLSGNGQDDRAIREALTVTVVPAGQRGRFRRRGHAPGRVAAVAPGLRPELHQRL